MPIPREIVLALTILQQLYVDINSPGTPYLPGNYAAIGTKLKGICTRIVAIPSGADGDLMMLTWKIAWKLEHARAESLNPGLDFDAYLTQNPQNHLGFAFGTILNADPVVARRSNHAVLAYETIIWEPENIALFKGVYSPATFLTLNQLVKSFIFPLTIDPEDEVQIQAKFRYIIFPPTAAASDLELVKNNAPDVALANPILEQVFKQIWEQRFLHNTRYQPRQKNILLGYSSTVDYSITLNSCIEALVEKAAEKKYPLDTIDDSKQKLANDLDNYLASLIAGTQSLPTKMETFEHILQAVLGHIALTSVGQIGRGKMPLNNAPTGDAMANRLSSITGATPVTGKSGGAAVICANGLIELGEKSVFLTIPYLFEELMNKLNSNLKVFWYQAGIPFGLIAEKPAKLNPENQPSIHNFIIEFSGAAALQYYPGRGVIYQPIKADRVIFTSSYKYYLVNPAGNYEIDKDRTPPDRTTFKTSGLLRFDHSINPIPVGDWDELIRCATTVPLKSDMFLLSGINSLDPRIFSDLLKELAAFKAAEIPVHIEISNANNLDLIAHLIRHGYIQSVSMGEEFEDLWKKVLPCAAPPANNYEKDIVRAVETARELGLKRMHIHGVDYDIIVRNGNLTLDERYREINAALVTKWVVITKLITGVIIPNIFPAAGSVIKQEALIAMRNLQSQFESSTGHGDRLDLYGAELEGYTVLVVPVRWVYGAMQDALIIVGAGDTSGFIYAAQILSWGNLISAPKKKEKYEH